MSDAVSRVIFHHEGAGAPTNDTSRPLHEKYSIAIGLTTYQMANPPWRSFITNGTRGRSLQVVFTGNREKFAVTDNDIKLVERAVAEAKSMQWVTALPNVQLHGDTDSTQCPGANVRARRADLERACGLLPVIKPPEEDDLPLNDADKQWIQTTVHDVVGAWLRSEDSEVLKQRTEAAKAGALEVVRSPEFSQIINNAAT